MLENTEAQKQSSDSELLGVLNKNQVSAIFAWSSLSSCGIGKENKKIGMSLNS